MNIKMTALQMIQEIALRLGIVRPSNISNIAGKVTTIADKDAEILLGSLNQSVRSAASAFTWRDMITMGRLVFKKNSTGCFEADLDACTEGYDGITTSFIYLHDAYPRMLKQLTFDKFLILGNTVAQGGSSPDLYSDRHNANGFTIMGRMVYTAAPLVDDAGEPIDVDVTGQMAYKCSYPIKSATNVRKTLFTDDFDTAIIDDEAVILGALMNYKNYIGRDFQLEAKLFTDYIEHMKERNGGLTIIEESEYATIADRMHRYPPHSSGARRQQPQQQQQQQQQQPQRVPQE